MVRNPKDLLVSLYSYRKTYPGDEYEGTLQDLFDCFIQGHITYGAWWKHVDTFTQLNNIHIIHYEDLLEVD